MQRGRLDSAGVWLSFGLPIPAELRCVVEVTGTLKDLSHSPLQSVGALHWPLKAEVL